MEKLQSSSIADSFWTYDTIVSNNRIASVREPLILTTQSGKHMVPCTLLYKTSDEGERQSPLIGGRYTKEVLMYDTAREYLNDPALRDFIVWDEKADIFLFALPIEKDSSFFSSQYMFNLIAGMNTSLGRSLQSIQQLFAGMVFGIFGSYGALIHSTDSDLDLLVHEGHDFTKLSSMLARSSLRNLLSIDLLSEEKITSYVHDYVRTFDVTHESGRKMFHARNRYILRMDDGHKIKIAFSGSFNKTNYTCSNTLLGSQKIRKVSTHGILINTDNASSFPREYGVLIDGKLTTVRTFVWRMRKTSEVGDTVKIRGYLREKDGAEFIALEDSTDSIVPV